MDGDGVVRVLAFGDSITYGIGDSGQLPKGYPSRLASILGVPVINAGNPGERITSASSRFFAALQNSKADLVLVMEGANDAVDQVGLGSVRDAYQRFINGTKALNRQIAVLTLIPPCCDREAQAQYTNGYSAEIKTLSDVNAVPLIDMKRAWDNTCQNKGACELYNIPEGLHPNAKGYDALAQTAAARILGVDIFSSGGASQLEQAAGLPAGSVIVQPDPAPAG